MMLHCTAPAANPPCRGRFGGETPQSTKHSPKAPVCCCPLVCMGQARPHCHLSPSHVPWATWPRRMLHLKWGWLLRAQTVGVPESITGASRPGAPPDPQNPDNGVARSAPGHRPAPVSTVHHLLRCSTALMGYGMPRFPPCWDAGRNQHPPRGTAGLGATTGEPGVRETESHTTMASFCAGNVPFPPPQNPHRLQGDQPQECKGRAIKGSVIKPQQSRQPAR